MEQRVNERAEQYVVEWKERFAQLAETMEKTPDVLRLMQFMCDYERLVFTQEDLQKRIRAKPAACGTAQCFAKSSNGQRCTRRRRSPEDLYCGTHLKGIPYGAFKPCGVGASGDPSSGGTSSGGSGSRSGTSSGGRSGRSGAGWGDGEGRDEGEDEDGGETSIFTREILGIVYYVDRHNQVYQAEDVLHGYAQPRVIGHCVSADGGQTYQVVLKGSAAGAS